MEEDDLVLGGVAEIYSGRRRHSLNPRQIGFLAAWPPNRRRSMPKVGGKHFPYTKKGYAAARKARGESDDKMPTKRKMRKMMKAAR